MTMIMTMVMRNTKNRGVPRLRLRNRIAAHALRLFRERGYDATSVDQITSAASVAKGTFFNFFPSKRAVLASYYESLSEFMATQLARLDPARPRASLVRLFRSLEGRLRDEGDLVCVLLREISLDPSLGARDADTGAEDLERYETFFKACRQMGSIRSGTDPRLAAEVTQDIWSSTVHRWILTHRGFSLAGALTRKLDALFMGLGSARSFSPTGEGHAGEHAHRRG